MRKKTLGFAGSFIAAGLAAWLLTGDGTAPPKNTGFSGSLGDQASGGFVVSGQAVSIDTIRVVYTMSRFSTVDSLKGHRSAEYLADIAAADHVVSLIDTGTPTSFAYGSVNYADADTASTAWIELGSTGYYRLPWLNNASGGRDIDENQSIHMVYVDFDSLFTIYRASGDVEVLEAKFKLASTGATYFATTDTVISTLNSVVGDTKWRNNKGVVWNNRTFYNASYMNGKYQVDWRAAGQHGYPSGTGGVDAWSPALSARDSIYDYGSYHDLSGGTWDAGVWTQGDALDIVWTNCVQGIAAGAVNNGIAMIYDDAEAVRSLDMYGPEPRFNASFYDKYPWITVTFTTKKYETRFPGGKQFAFLFSSDDGRPINGTWTRLFRDHGGKMTVFTIGGATSFASSEAQAESLLSWREVPAEIGYHSLHHWATVGVSKYDVRPTGHALFDTVDYSRGMSFDFNAAGDTLIAMSNTTTATGWDSLMADVDPARLYQLMDYYYPNNNYRNDSLFGKVFAYPVQTNPVGTVNKALDLFGYKAWRSTQNSDHNADNRKDKGAPPWTIEMPGTSNNCDTARAGFPFTGINTPYNPRLITTTASVVAAVGDTTDTPTELQVKTYVRDMVTNLMASGVDAYILYSHSPKGANGALEGGIDTSELTWVLEEIVRLGGWICTHSEYYDWVTHMRGLTWIDTPAGYSQHDSLRFTAEDQVWIQFEY